MASNITFIIGNGLDLSLGLKTSYKDFYQSVQNKKADSNNRIYQSIQKRPESWSDFELELGKYTHYIKKFPDADRKKESNEFHEELEELRDDLAEYLESQENSIENLADSFTFSFTNSGFFEELPSGQSERIQHYLSNIPVNINFVTLNYTKTLEKILSDNKLPSSRGVIFRVPQHIHGDLLANLTLGVSDESQLFSGMSGREKSDLIKSELISSMNDGRIASLQNAIGGSSLLVFFGTSVGATDKYIWEYVIEWLSLSSDRHIIIHKYDSAYVDSIRRSSRRQKQFIESVQDRLLNHSDLDTSEKEALKSRIFVIHNTKKLFVPKNS